MTAVTEHEKDLERIANFSMMDDDFFTACLAEEIECTQLILRIILGKADLQVVQSHAQYFIKNLQGRSVRLDVLAKDMFGRYFNIEMQQANSGASPRRARYNSSVLDANITNPGEYYDQLPDSYVIFITEHDVLKGNRPVYDIQRTVSGSGAPFNDGSHIVYVNASVQDDTDLGKLMFDLHCKDPNQMHYSVLASRCRYFKEDEEGVRKMCKVLEDMRAEAAAKATLETSSKIAMSMLNDHMPVEVIAKYTGLSTVVIEKLASQNPGTVLPN